MLWCMSWQFGMLILVCWCLWLFSLSIASYWFCHFLQIFDNLWLAVHGCLFLHSYSYGKLKLSCLSSFTYLSEYPAQPWTVFLGLSIDPSFRKAYRHLWKLFSQTCTLHLVGRGGIKRMRNYSSSLKWHLRVILFFLSPYC